MSNNNNNPKSSGVHPQSRARSRAAPRTKKSLRELVQRQLAQDPTPVPCAEARIRGRGGRPPSTHAFSHAHIGQDASLASTSIHMHCITNAGSGSLSRTPSHQTLTFTSTAATGRPLFELITPREPSCTPSDTTSDPQTLPEVTAAITRRGSLPSTRSVLLMS